MSVTWQEAAQEFMTVAQRLWDRGLIAGSGGNLSLRVPGTGQIMIKPSGIANVDCRPETLLGVDANGNVVAGKGRPSKDLGFHLGIYRERPGVQGIVHAHAPWATALTLLDYQTLPLHTPHAQDKLCRVPIVPYAPSGSDELNNAVAEALRFEQAVAVLLERHGLVVAGRSLSSAAGLAEMVEETAQIALLARLGGCLPGAG